MDTIFITGGSGLLALNWAVTIRDDSRVFLGLYDRKVSLTGVGSMFINLNSVDDLTNILSNCKAQIVVHTAGLTSVEECEANPELARHVNSDLSYNVAKACNRLGVRMVHISTDHLFSGDIPLVDENHPVNPKNVYGRTKAEAEIRVLETHPSALVIRTNFYGWGPKYRSSFSDIIVNALRTGKELNLFQDVYYTPILAETMVLQVHDLISKQAEGIFNVVGDDRISKYEFGLQLARQYNYDTNKINPVLMVEKADLVQRPHDLSLSNRKTCEFLKRHSGSITADIARLYKQEHLNKIKELKSL